ncbi:MAG: histidine phosphatase family protein [Anaerolineae bacterium]|nr:histidine phosphatase family protein [Anaerolineae bacterium]
MTRFFLIRHGCTQASDEPWFRGRVDVQLDSIGKSQAEATALWITGQHTVDAVFSSPLVRARQTAEVIARVLRLPVQVHRGLIDINYGVWQGLRLCEVRSRWLKLLNMWNTRPHETCIPGGERLHEVRSRAVAALFEIGNCYPEGCVVLVSHAVVNRLILLEAKGWKNNRLWEITQGNCELNVLALRDEQLHLIVEHQLSHLDMLDFGGMEHV